MAALTCPACGKPLRVAERCGRRLVLEHECDGEPRKDASHPEPGTADGAKRYG